MPNDSAPTREPEQCDGRELSRVEPQAQDHGRQEQAHDEPVVPSKTALLAKLDYLAGCVAIGALPPPKANAMRAIYATLLSHLDDVSAVGVGALSDEDVVRTLRESPEMLKLLKPMLTREQIALIMREAPND